MYKYHVENLRELDYAFKVIENSIKDAIREGDKEKEYIFTLLATQIIGNWAEVRLHKLLHEIKCFSDIELNFINCSSSSLEERWLNTFRLSVCRHFKIKLTRDDKMIMARLNRIDYHMYSDIVEVIENYMVPSINLRNRIAHGQLKKVLNSDLTQISEDLMREINTINIIKVQNMYKILKLLSQLINDISISPSTYLRDFNLIYSNIKKFADNKHKRNYEKYCNTLIDRYQRGVIKRKSNLGR